MRFEVKHLITVGAVLAILGASFGSAFATPDSPKVPPKGIEGPDIRGQVPPKGIESPDIRENTRPLFFGLEGPDSR